MNIVVGYLPTPAGRAALRAAIDEAKLRAADLVVVQGHHTKRWGRHTGPEETETAVREDRAALDAAEDRRGADIIRLCMLTGARVGEVRTARFEQFNLDYAIWSKPASTTKQRKIHRVPISQDVAAIVRLRQQAVPRGNPWLFPGDTVGQPVREIRRFWAKVQKENGRASCRERE